MRACDEKKGVLKQSIYHEHIQPRVLMCVCVCVCVCVYQIDRERERERERDVKVCV